MNQTAYIHPDSVLGNNIKVLHNSYIGANCEIGDDCVIGPNSVIMSHTKLGKKCKVFPGAVIGCIPQDLKYNGEESFVEIGDETSIREFATIHRGTVDKMVTKVGSNCLVMAYVHLAHDCSVGNHVIIGNNTQMAGHVSVDDWAIIGGACAIHQKLNIGKHSFVGGGAYLNKDVPPYIKVRGNPFNSYAGVNSIGLKRRDFRQEKINHILDAYRIIYNSGYNTSHALDKLKKLQTLNGTHNDIIKFIEQSTAGIIQRAKKVNEDNKEEISFQ